MNYRLTLVLLAVLVMLGGVLYWSERGEDDRPTPTPTGERLFNFDAAIVSDLAIGWAGKEVSFQRQSSGRWQLTQPEAVPADDTAVEGTLYALSRLHSERDFAAKSSDLGSFGLDQPRGGITVTLVSGDKQRLLIGGPNPDNSAHYARRPVGDQEVVVRILPAAVVAALRQLVDTPPAAATPAPPSSTPSADLTPIGGR